MRILVTGANGLIGGAAVEYFDALGHTIVGIDNNMRQEFFGKAADVKWNLHRIFHHAKNYTPLNVDIRELGYLEEMFQKQGPFDAIIHCAAQPSHDYASKNPDLDYAVNVQGTKNLLVFASQYSPGAVFIFTSTNKVYDDAVNSEAFIEILSRYDKPYAWSGFDETTPTGASNVFGAHKLEADKMVQEAAKAGLLKTVVVRGGCLTGPGHSGVEQHGFLSYLLKCAITDKMYNIFGYKGKQVRDNIHSYDVCTAFHEIIKNPRSGEVYNIGGGRENGASILEAIALIEEMTGRKVNYNVVLDPRDGDHQCYITDMSKFRAHYPNWKITKSLRDTLGDMIFNDFWGRYCEHEDTRTYPLTGNSFVWDVGGFRGSWTESILKKYPNVHVHLYEPVKEFADACAYRFRDNQDVRVLNYGLGTANESLLIQKQGQNSSLVRGGEGQRAMPYDKVSGEPVPEKIRLRDIVDEVKIFYYSYGDHDIDLVSFNCEGGEYAALERLIDFNLIKKFKYVQIQFHNFADWAPARRDKIRELLRKTHTEIFNYPFVWEGWKLKQKEK